MEGLVLVILKNGSVAFIGSKLTKVIGQKEISEMIAGAGWAVVGIEIVSAVMPILVSIDKFFEKADNLVANINRIVDKIISFLPFI